MGKTGKIKVKDLLEGMKMMNVKIENDLSCVEMVTITFNKEEVNKLQKLSNIGNSKKVQVYMNNEAAYITRKDYDTNKSEIDDLKFKDIRFD